MSTYLVADATDAAVDTGLSWSLWRAQGSACAEMQLGTTVEVMSVFWLEKHVQWLGASILGAFLQNSIRRAILGLTIGRCCAYKDPQRA